MPLYDFQCSLCDETFEAIVPVDKTVTACSNEACAGMGERLMPRTHSFSVIQATHTKSKKHKAGYVHSHGDKPKTPGKIQVGYGS